MTLEKEARTISRTFVIKAQIKELVDRHGNVINLWPEFAQKRFEQLSKERQEIENSDLHSTR